MGEHMLEKSNRFSRVNISIEAIAICNLILSMFTEVSFEQTGGVAVYSLALLIDILLVTVISSGKLKVIAIGLRYFSILSLSVYIVFFYNKCLLAVTVLLLLSQIFDLIFRVDFMDMYSRLMVLSLSSFPIALLTIIQQLFFSKVGNAYTIEMISVVAALIVTASCVSTIFIDWVATYDKRLLEQRRKNENAEEANESLLLFQEKLRKVNEEIGIQKIRVESANRQVNKSNAEMKVQNEVLKYVSSTIDQKELLQKASQSLRDSMDLKFCVVAMYDVSNENQLVYSESHRDISEAFMEYIRDSILVRRTADLAALDRIHIEKAMHKLYSTVLDQQDELAVIISVPVMGENGVEGIIVCGHERQDYFDESRTVFENIAAQLMMAGKNAKLYAQVQQMAIRDGLTGLYNRRQLNQLVDQFSKLAVSENTPLTAVLMDIDNFKRFNDTYGHAFGDTVLTELAKLIEKCTQSAGDKAISARYGGEEFVMVFPGRGIEETYQIVSKLQETINGTSLDYSGKPVSIHVSIGISSYPETAERPEAILNRADAAMYHAKQTGKNRITVDSDEVLAFFRSMSKKTE